MGYRSYLTQTSHLTPGETKAQQRPDFPKSSLQLVSELGLPFPENQRHFWFPNRLSSAQDSIFLLRAAIYS